MDGVKVLDLFVGLGGWSAAFRERGHQVTTLDYAPKFHPDILADILKIDSGFILDRVDRPDIILASPPCECFSVASLNHYWKSGRPANEKTLRAIAIVLKTLKIIEELDPKFWFLENPRGMLRKQEFMKHYRRRTVTYCKYGERFMKPTDLWGHKPPSLVLLPPCRNGMKCHMPSRRGGKQTGLQSVHGAANRSLIPYKLSLDVCLAAERDFDNPGPKEKQSRLSIKK